jgi:NADPH:quinone reductase
METAKKMQQVQFSAFGDASVLQVVAADMPVPGPGELLIRIEAIGINYSDILRRRNTYFMPTPLPYVLGAEAVGQVVGHGAGVADAPPFQSGARVLAILPHGGGYAEYVTCPAQFCVPLPGHLDPKAATAIFVQGSTAHLILHDLLGGVAGKTLLVHAAAGGVGSLLVQLARLAGAQRVIGTASSPEKCAAAIAFGADAAVDYSQEGWPDAVKAANGGAGVDIVLEMVGGAVYARSFDCLRDGGTMVVYGQASGEKGYVHSEHFVDAGLRLLGFNLAHVIGTRMPAWQQALGAVIGLLAEGRIQVGLAHSFPLAEAAAAHSAIEARRTIGKVVLLP